MKRPPEEPAALEKRAQPGRVRAIILAIAVHAAFFALIVFGVTWQSRPSAPVQAELWDKLPPAPKSTPPKPAPEPPQPEPPKPEPPRPPKPEPPKEEVKPPPPKPDPAIALKLEREKREREKKEAEKRERLEKAKQEEVRMKRELEEAAKKRREDDKRRVEEERVRKEAEKQREEAEKQREEAAGARQRAIDGFVNQIKAKIRGRANVPDTVSGKPSVQVRIRILPGGEVLDIAVTRSSGNRVYDTAIERAIRGASPLPVPDASSELFPTFRDLILNIDHER